MKKMLFFICMFTLHLFANCELADYIPTNFSSLLPTCRLPIWRPDLSTIYNRFLYGFAGVFCVSLIAQKTQEYRVKNKAIDMSKLKGKSEKIFFMKYPFFTVEAVSLLGFIGLLGYKYAPIRFGKATR